MGRHLARTTNNSPDVKSQLELAAAKNPGPSRRKLAPITVDDETFKVPSHPILKGNQTSSLPALKP